MRPERCRRQRTGQEDRRSKFYEVSDNLPRSPRPERGSRPGPARSNRIRPSGPRGTIEAAHAWRRPSRPAAGCRSPRRAPAGSARPRPRPPRPGPLRCWLRRCPPAGERLIGFVEVGEQGVKAEAALEVARRALLSEWLVMSVASRSIVTRWGFAPSFHACSRAFARAARSSSKRAGSCAIRSITRKAVESEATSPKSGCWSRTERRSARQSPPSASITARSRTTRPGS